MLQLLMKHQDDLPRPGELAIELALSKEKALLTLWLSSYKLLGRKMLRALWLSPGRMDGGSLDDCSPAVRH
jgi:hypothetical protein